MKYYTFYRENNNFDDILNDVAIKKIISTKILWYQYLMIGLDERTNEKNFSYITIKYGDDIKNPNIKDFTPVPGVDYIPKKDKNSYKRSIK
jgi:hypothetical protein